MMKRERDVGSERVLVLNYKKAYYRALCTMHTSFAMNCLQNHLTRTHLSYVKFFNIRFFSSRSN